MSKGEIDYCMAYSAAQYALVLRNTSVKAGNISLVPYRSATTKHITMSPKDKEYSVITLQRDAVSPYEI